MDPYSRSLDLIADKKYEEAVKLLTESKKRSENDWRIFHYLGICYEKLGRRYRAEDAFLKAINRGASYRPSYRLGLMYIQSGKPDKALLHLRRVKRTDPDFIRGRFYLAIAAFYANRIDESLENFRYILDKRGTSPNSLAGIGVIKYYQGNPSQAVEFLIRSIEYAPEWSGGHYQLGTIYLRMGRYAEAAVQFRQCLKYDKDNDEARYHLALSLEKISKEAEAEKLFESLLEKEDLSRIIRASIMIKKGEYIKARDILLENIHDSLNPFEVYSKLGYIYSLVTGEMQKAIEAYRQALTYRPRSITVRYKLGVLLQRQGRAEEARREFDRILTIDPVSSQGYFLQGIIYGRRGDFKKAESFLKTAVNMNREDLQGRQVLLNILIQNDKLREAASIAEEVHSEAPENIEITTLLVRIFIKMGEYKRAEDLLESIIDTSNPDIQKIELIRLLYSVYRELNRTDKIEHLREVILRMGIDPFEEHIINF